MLSEKQKSINDYSIYLCQDEIQEQERSSSMVYWPISCTASNDHNINLLAHVCKGAGG
jgi:hypothetical protein